MNNDAMIRTVIERLNEHGVLVSIDYEVDGTYSLTMLRNSKFSDTCWEMEYAAHRVTNLYDTLIVGEHKLAHE